MATFCASAYTMIVLVYTLTFQPAFLTNLKNSGGPGIAVFATPLHFSLPPSQLISIMQVGWTSSTSAMTHVHTSLEGGGTRREPCLGMTAIALSLALLPGMFWKVPCPTTLCSTSDAVCSTLLVSAVLCHDVLCHAVPCHVVPSYALPCCAVPMSCSLLQVLQTTEHHQDHIAHCSSSILKSLFPIMVLVLFCLTCSLVLARHDQQCLNLAKAFCISWVASAVKHLLQLLLPCKLWFRFAVFAHSI